VEFSLEFLPGFLSRWCFFSRWLFGPFNRSASKLWCFWLACSVFLSLSAAHVFIGSGIWLHQSLWHR
jgi:hypothetical protein